MLFKQHGINEKTPPMFSGGGSDVGGTNCVSELNALTESIFTGDTGSENLYKYGYFHFFIQFTCIRSQDLHKWKKSNVKSNIYIYMTDITEYCQLTI